jgi:2-amino-4-hydroxy-6-hydroxymethyldihydropteridine diphosphokinase
VERAARGVLPEWARASAARRQHMARVAELLDRWSEGLGLAERERTRWRSVAYLHDALKDEPPEALRGWVEGPLAEVPGAVIHGPAAAARLEEEGVDDAELLDAVRYHTLGHPRLGRLGRALFAADFLEPGRDLENEWRARLRSRMPQGLDGVVREILQGRILHLVGGGSPVREETIGFWNQLAEGGPWASAS